MSIYIKTNEYVLPLPNTRKLAKELNTKFYFNGKPCKHDHVSHRYAVGGSCVECKKINDKKRYHDNPEYHNENSRKHREDNPDYHREHNRQYYQDNKDDLLKRQREYNKNNRDIRNTNHAKRRAQQANATPLYVAPPFKQKESKEQKAEFKDIRKLMNDQIKDIYAESRRLTEETGIPHHVDHIYPITHDEQTGLHVPWNLQILTESENISKSNRLPNDPLGYHLHPLNPNRVNPDPTQRML